MDILYIPTYPLMELSAITLAAQWQAIGIRAEPRSTEVGVWLDLRTKTFDYYISTNLDFPTIDPDVYLYDTFHSTSAPAGWDAWSDPELDALLEQGHATVDVPERQEIFTQVAEAAGRSAAPRTGATRRTSSTCSNRTSWASSRTRADIRSVWRRPGFSSNSNLLNAPYQPPSARRSAGKREYGVVAFVAGNRS